MSDGCVCGRLAEAFIIPEPSRGHFAECDALRKRPEMRTDAERRMIAMAEHFMKEPLAVPSNERPGGGR